MLSNALRSVTPLSAEAFSTKGFSRFTVVRMFAPALSDLQHYGSPHCKNEKKNVDEVSKGNTQFPRKPSLPSGPPSFFEPGEQARQGEAEGEVHDGHGDPGLEAAVGGDGDFAQAQL